MSNAKLAEDIPVELNRAGFAGMKFSPIPHHVWSDVGPQAVVDTTADRTARVVCIWQTPVGVIHASSGLEMNDADIADPELLEIFAEGLGAILERNVVLERVQTMRRVAQEHSHEIHVQVDLSETEMWSSDAAAECDRASNSLTDFDNLSLRERQLLSLIGLGLTNAQNADQNFRER